jgi:hypothetical protein
LKEPRYFDRNLSRRPLFWYSRLYRGVDTDLRGDMSTSYIRLQLDGVRFVRRLIPDVKLFCVVRDPVHRAWSGYRRWPYLKLEPSPTDVDRYLRWSALAFRHWGSIPVEYSFYSTLLHNWIATFGKSHLLVLSHRELAENPKEVIRKLLAFLGVSINRYPWDHIRPARINANPTLPMPDDILEMLSTRYSGEHERLQALLETDDRFW